jgi:hypothetical protein
MPTIEGIPYATDSTAPLDPTLPYLHIATYSASVQAERFPNGEIVDAHDNREELELWAKEYKADNPGIATSYVIPNPKVG